MDASSETDGDDSVLCEGIYASYCTENVLGSPRMPLLRSVTRIPHFIAQDAE